MSSPEESSEEELPNPVEAEEETQPLKPREAVRLIDKLTRERNGLPVVDINEVEADLNAIREMPSEDLVSSQDGLDWLQKHPPQETTDRLPQQSEDPPEQD